MGRWIAWLGGRSCVDVDVVVVVVLMGVLEAEKDAKWVGVRPVDASSAVHAARVARWISWAA